MSTSVRLLIALSLTSPGAASAQPALSVSGEQRLTLADAIARGFETSHLLAEYQARREAARAAVAGRAAEGRPELAVIAGYTRTNHVEEFGVIQPSGRLRLLYPDVPDNYRARLDLVWPIYTAGRTEALARAAEAESRAADHDLAMTRANLRLEITRAFWALVTAEETEAVVLAAHDRIAAHLHDVRNRLNVGLVPPSDVLSVESQQSRQRALAIEARNARALAAADLARLTGLDPEKPIRLEAALDPSGPERPERDEGDDAQPLVQLVAAASQARPERQALAVRAEAADARREAVAAARRPQISVAGGLDYARPNPRIFPRAAEWKESWDLGLTVSWALWDGGRLAADLAEAQAISRAADRRLRDFDTIVALEVRQRRLDLESARAAAGAAADAARSAVEARRVLADRFAAGVATSVDLVDAQLTLLQAELDRTRARSNVRLAEARLERALGR